MHLVSCNSGADSFFFFVDPSELYILKIMLSENGGSFASSSSMWMPFISYLFPISFYSYGLG